MYDIYVNHVIYHLFSAVLGMALLFEAMRSIYIYVRIVRHPYMKIEWVLRNVKVGNIVLLLMLSVREFAEAIIIGRTGINYPILIILRLVPPILYIYLQRVVSALLFNNEAFGINSYRHTCIKWLDKIAHREKKEPRTR